MAPPVVSVLSPGNGPVSGGNTVVITGVGFAGTTKVSFGSTSVAFLVNSSTQITVTAPPVAAPTSVNVTVTGPGGTSTGAAIYTYLGLPAITAVTPDAGPPAGGNTVTIHGTNLFQVNSVHFDQTGAGSFSIDSDNQIRVAAPSGSGTVQVSVTTAGGTSTVSTCSFYSYLGVPVVTNLNPGAGPTVGGNSVAITGASFTYATNVFFGASTVPFSVVSDTRIVARAPSGTGTIGVNVANPAGASSASLPYVYE